MIQRTFITMSYVEYEKLISTLADRPYEDSIADNEWNNYSCYQYEIDKNDSCGSDLEWKEYGSFLDGTDNFLPSARFMLYVLYLMHLIEEGDYLIEVYW